jgi:hypothetical protein
MYHYIEAENSIIYREDMNENCSCECSHLMPRERRLAAGIRNTCQQVLVKNVRGRRGPPDKFTHVAFVCNRQVTKPTVIPFTDQITVKPLDSRDINTTGCVLYL